MAAPLHESGSVLKDAFRYLPGGRIATIGFQQPLPPTFLIERGQGAYVYTDTGSRLLDVALGSASLIVGHCSPTVSGAVHAQIERGVLFGHPSLPVIDLARLFVKAVPCAQKLRFVNSASEAILYALRAIRTLMGKEKVLKFEGAYHGFADPLLYKTNYGDPSRWSDWPAATPDSPGIPAAERELVLVAPYNDIETTRAIVHAHRAELGAIFVEPVMRGIASRPGFLESIRDLTSELRIPLVFDETITGFRLAYGGAQEYYGVIPDLAVYGKGLGAGYPIGAIAGTEEMMSVFDPATPDGQRIYALGSFHGNPLSATAAAANLRELGRPNVYDRLNDYGNRLRAGLEEVFGRFGLKTQMTGVGSIVEFFFTSEPITDYRSTLRSTLRYKQLLAGELPRHGVFGGGGRYTNSTCHGADELNLMLSAVEASLHEMRRKGALS